MVQGKTEKVNYKVKKHIAKPEGEWVKVENTHEAIISVDDFAVVQHLMKADGRRSPDSGTPSPFMGLLFCGDCGQQMVRRVIRYKDTAKVYYICSTKNRGEGCSRHSIEESTLKEIVCESIRKFANSFLKEKELFDHAVQYETNFELSSTQSLNVFSRPAESAPFLNISLMSCSCFCMAASSSFPFCEKPLCRRSNSSFVTTPSRKSSYRPEQREGMRLRLWQELAGRF